MQPSSDVRVEARRATEIAGTNRSVFDAALPRRADQEEILKRGLWSALQTHLQGVDGATPAMVLEKCRHCVALLSRSVG
jgi:hypothetical protein